MEEKISPYELFAIIFMVPYGSAILFFIIPEVKESAWFVIMLYAIPALLIQWVYITLYRNYPKDTLVSYLPKIFGRLIGKMLGFAYVTYFAYIAARVLRDFSGLIAISAMAQTPIWHITAVLIITVTYGVSKGLENLSRFISTFFAIMSILLIILLILYYRTPNIIDMENLLPFLPEGILKPVIQGWKVLTFPYGETIIGTMIYCNVNNGGKVSRAVFWAIVSEGVIIGVLNATFLVGLGVNFSGKELFPLLDALRLIRISGFLDRLDLFIIVVLVFEGFIKISFFIYVSVAGFSQITGIKNKGRLSWFFGVVIFAASLMIAKSFPQHLNIGLNFTPKYIHLPLQIALPILALIVHYMRNGFRKKSDKGCSETKPSPA